jgi:hypothetical protein
MIRLSAVANIPRLDEVALNGPVLLFALVTSVAAKLLAGFLPAWQLANANPLQSIGLTRSTPVANRSGRVRWLLVSLEVGVSTICLVAAGIALS